MCSRKGKKTLSLKLDIY